MQLPPSTPSTSSCLDSGYASGYSFTLTFYRLITTLNLPFYQTINVGDTATNDHPNRIVLRGRHHYTIGWRQGVLGSGHFHY